MNCFLLFFSPCKIFGVFAREINEVYHIVNFVWWFLSVIGCWLNTDVKNRWCSALCVHSTNMEMFFFFFCGVSLFTCIQNDKPLSDWWEILTRCFDSRHVWQSYRICDFSVHSICCMFLLLFRAEAGEPRGDLLPILNFEKKAVYKAE